MLPSADIKDLTLKDYFEIVKKRSSIIVSIIAAALTFTICYIVVTPKIYETSARLVIEQQIAKITGGVEEVYESRIRNDEYFQTQVNILGARVLAARVLDKGTLRQDEEFIEARDPVSKLLSMIKVKPLRNSTMVILFVQGKDPLKITKITNIWIREFIRFDMERKTGTAEYGVNWLEGQLKSTLKKLQKSERNLNNFTKKNKIISGNNMQVQKKDILDNLQEQRVQIEKEIEVVSKRYGPKHPKIIVANSKLKTIDDQLKKETTSYLFLQDMMGEYNSLKKNVDTYKVLYDELFMRAKELDVSKELSVSNIRIIDLAEVPKDHIKPQAKRDLMLGFLLSAVLGIGLAFVLESMDSTLKTAEDVLAYTKFPFLGYIPVSKESAKKLDNSYLTVYSKPQSTIADAFRNIKVSLIFSTPPDKPLQIILFASSIPGEGKSFCASNLAATFSQAGEATLLIDADLRRGRLHHVFGKDNKIGLSTLLTGLASIDETIVTTSVKNLYLLSCGPYAPNPAELLGSERASNILVELKKKFKRIIIDSVPVLGIADALIFGEKADGIVFIIKAASTPYKLITEARRVLSSNLKVTGVILNQKRVETDKSYYYYHSEAERKK